MKNARRARARSVRLRSILIDEPPDLRADVARESEAESAISLELASDVALVIRATRPAPRVFTNPELIYFHLPWLHIAPKKLSNQRTSERREDLAL